MSRLLQELFARDALSSLDLELALSLGQLGREADDAVLLALALTSRAVQEGHVCLDLAHCARTPWLDESGVAYASLPTLESWLAALERSPLVALHAQSEREPRPLVLDRDHKLYLARYHDHECSVAEHVLRMARATVASGRPDEALVDQLFPARPEGKVDLQREAALASCSRTLSVIVGGPGTGKTSTVVKLLALLVHGALAEGLPVPRMLLVAPTGKAAQRLSESIAGSRDRLPLAPELRARIPSEAVTVHRALGPIAGSSTRFRHDADEPLECDVLLLDEASMVDLALMRRLLDAVPAHARVIMLGDPDQLASVEAGGVLADICAAALQEGPLAGSVSRLSESYRYDENSGIAALARAVHAGDAALAIDVLRSARDDVRFSASLPVPRLGRVLESEVRTHYRGFMARELESKLRVLDDFRVLAAHRRGELGVEHLNHCIARVLRGQRARSQDNYPGRPVLITQNDYGSSLFNGDVGVLHSERRNGPLQACFRTGPESVRRVALGRLPNHESVYAMTVHKSQGSEFRHVALVLPDPSSPVLTRELLYTAITRARSSLSVYGSEAALRAAIERRAERSSGLTARLIAR